MPRYFASMYGWILPAVYLAAGEGRRLRPLTARPPQGDVEVGGMPLAERALRSLRRPA